MAFLRDRVAENQPPAAAPKLAEPLSVTVQRLKFHNDETGFFIAEGVAVGALPPLPQELAEMGVRTSNSVALKGTSQSFQGNDNIGATLRCHGEWVVDPRHGLQFSVHFVHDSAPTTPAALQKYLGSGRLKGIGPATAKEMVDKWGVDVIRILEETPERLSEISGLTAAKIETIKKAWKDKKEMYGIVSFLGLHGIGETLAVRVRDTFGMDNLEKKIRANPYLLTEVEGIGFKKADDLAISMGFPENSPQRLAAALQHVLREKIVKEGHTALPVSMWIQEACVSLSRPREEVRAMCQKLVDAKSVILRTLKVVIGEEGVVDAVCASPRREALAERSVANHLKRLMESVQDITMNDETIIARVMDDPARRLDPSQKEAMWRNLHAPASVLTGGPGTGKTTTLRSIVDAATQMGLRVILAAPTGRAAKRMEEAIGVEAMTMHRRLGFAPGVGFKKNEQDPMEGDLFIVDESSMVDVTMLAAWLRAIPTGARVMLVGDADQLPSVGAGDVLRDLIDSDHLPVSRLTKVHRQAEGSGIAWNATQVLAGKCPTLEGDPWVDDFAFVRIAGSTTQEQNQGIRDKLVEVVEGFLRQGVAPQDIQVLCPQKNHECGTEALNDMLRGLLNPHRPDAERLAEGGMQVGERLMQTKNNYDQEVFNGDMGNVTKLHEDGRVEMEMEDGRKITYGKHEVRDLQFGYAITVHKSQGGERPVIILPMSRSHSYGFNRSLLYTAITRGKDRVVLIGDAQTALMAAKKKDQLVRMTGLLNELSVVNVPKLGAARQAGAFRP